MAQASSVLQAEKDDGLMDKLHAWAVKIINQRTEARAENAPLIDGLTVAASNKELAEQLCFKPADILFKHADDLPLLHEGDDIVQVYAKTVRLYV